MGIAAAVLEALDSIDLDTPFAERGMDSLDYLDFIVQVEALSGRMVDKDAMLTMKTPRDLIAYLDRSISHPYLSN
jgi:acyl carrier protein